MNKLELLEPNQAIYASHTHTQKSRTNHSSAPATLGMSKTVSHPTLQVISCTVAIKRNLTFDTANWSSVFLVLREKKIKRWNNKISCWVCLDTGNAGDVNWLYEISEINYLCKRMPFVYSTVRVAATQSGKLISVHHFLSWILLFIHAVCLQHLMSPHLLPIISHRADLHDLLHCTDSSVHVALTVFWLKRNLLFAELCYYTARSVVI